MVDVRWVECRRGMSETETFTQAFGDLVQAEIDIWTQAFLSITSRRCANQMITRPIMTKFENEEVGAR